MCPLIYQPTNAVSPSVLLSTKSWKVPMEVEGIQGLVQDILFFKTIVELDNTVVIEVQILLEHLENFFFYFIVSNATIYSRESNKNNKKKQHIDDSHQQELQSYKLAQLQKRRSL